MFKIGRSNNLKYGRKEIDMRSGVYFPAGLYYIVVPNPETKCAEVMVISIILNNKMIYVHISHIDKNDVDNRFQKKTGWTQLKTEDAGKNELEFIDFINQNQTSGHFELGEGESFHNREGFFWKFKIRLERFLIWRNGLTSCKPIGEIIDESFGELLSSHPINHIDTR